MRILFWSGNFLPMIGGAEVLAAKLLPALRERGHEFIVVTSQRRTNLPPEGVYEGIPVYRLPFRGNADMDQLIDTRSRVDKVKRDFAPDLIHISDVDLGHFFHLISARSNPAPYLVTLHSYLSTQKIGRASWMEHLIRSADWLTGVSMAVLADARQMIPETTFRSSVVYNGLASSSLHPEPLGFDSPRLLCLGRLISGKGFGIAISAFASVIRRFPRALLIIAGDGPVRADLERQATELKLGERVQFFGWVKPEDVPFLINTATLVLMPSRFEGLPLVALEAAQMGRPVIGSRAPGLSEVVVHGDTGLLVEPEDPLALADAARYLLDNPQRAIIMGHAARRRAEHVFSWNNCVHGYDNLYRQLSGAGKSKYRQIGTMVPVGEIVQSN